MATTPGYIRVRQNGANATQVIQVVSGATGQFEDTTNSDNFISTDDINYSILTGGEVVVAGVISMTYMGVKILNTDVDEVAKIVQAILPRRMRVGVGL